jgi:hypothetical protein
MAKYYSHFNMERQNSRFSALYALILKYKTGNRLPVYITHFSRHACIIDLPDACTNQKMKSLATITNNNLKHEKPAGSSNDKQSLKPKTKARRQTLAKCLVAK